MGVSTPFGMFVSQVLTFILTNRFTDFSLFNIIFAICVLGDFF